MSKCFGKSRLRNGLGWSWYLQYLFFWRGGWGWQVLSFDCYVNILDIKVLLKCFLPVFNWLFSSIQQYILKIYKPLYYKNKGYCICHASENIYFLIQVCLLMIFGLVHSLAPPYQVWGCRLLWTGSRLTKRVLTEMGPQGNCPQNLVRAHKMLRTRAKMALENVGIFQHLMCKRY